MWIVRCGILTRQCDEIQGNECQMLIWRCWLFKVLSSAFGCAIRGFTTFVQPRRFTVVWVEAAALVAMPTCAAFSVQTAGRKKMVLGCASAYWFPVRGVSWSFVDCFPAHFLRLCVCWFFCSCDFDLMRKDFQNIASWSLYRSSAVVNGRRSF
jgi:hypothetical protein